MNKQYQTVVFGHKVTLRCASNGETKWTFQDKKLPDNVQLSGYQDNDLIIKYAIYSNTGRYKCYGLNYDNQTYFLTEAHIHVESEW